MLHLFDLPAGLAFPACVAGCGWLGAVDRLREAQRQRPPPDASWTAEQICVAQFPARDMLP